MAEQHAGDPVAPGPAARRGESRWSGIAFVAFMAVLTVLFAALGLWQLDRLAEKEALIAAVEARAEADPVPLPAAAEFAALDPEAWDFRPVRLEGSFDHARTVRVFTNLDAPRGAHGGPGYWVMAPLALDEGGTVWVNRGFVPQSLAENFRDGGPAPEGTVELVGIARAPEAANVFTPGADRAERIEWVRDPERLAAAAGIAGGGAPLAPVYVDAEAGEPGALPQGGETVTSFPNRHLEYAGTWLIFAALTPILVGVWLWRRRRG